MEEKVKKQKFLQLQFCTLLLVLTLLPEMNVASVFGVPDIDIPVFCCKVVGIIGAGLALYGFYKSAQDVSAALPMPFLASSAGGLLYTCVRIASASTGCVGEVKVLISFLWLFCCTFMMA